MGIIDRSIEWIYSHASKRTAGSWILTPVVGTLFSLFTSLFVYVPIKLERMLEFPVFISVPLKYYIATPLAAAGVLMMIITNIQYAMLRGTAVPTTPPETLITTGLFRYSRNPMHTGVFLLMYGFAFYYSSIFAVLVFIPLYIFFDVRLIKKIEEPELLKRLGKPYEEYRNKTPMFIPSIFRK